MKRRMPNLLIAFKFSIMLIPYLLLIAPVQVLQSYRKDKPSPLKAELNVLRTIFVAVLNLARADTMAIYRVAPSATGTGVSLPSIRPT